MPIEKPNSAPIADSDRHPVALDSIRDDGHRLHALACHLLHDHHHADDAVQETLLAAVRGARGPVRDTSAWLRGVLRRVSANARRRDRVRRVRETRAITVEPRPTHWERDSDPVIERERDLDVARAVSELDPPYREVVKLTYFEELDSQEVAHRLGVPAATVRTRLHRARVSLRQKLAARYGPAVAFLPWIGGPKAWSPVPASTAGGITLGAKVAVSLVLSLSLMGTFFASEFTVDAGQRGGNQEREPARTTRGMTAAQDAVERARTFPPTDPPGALMVVDSPRLPQGEPSRPYRSDARARLARFEDEIRPPFLRYHELPTWLRPHAPRYGLFLQRAEGDIAILDLRDERNQSRLIDANVRHQAEAMLFEYDAQLVAQETYVTHRVAAGEVRGFGPGSIPVLSSSETENGVILSGQADGTVAVIEVDDAFHADRAARADRLEDLRHRLGVHRAVLAVTRAR